MPEHTPAEQHGKEAASAANTGAVLDATCKRERTCAGRDTYRLDGACSNCGWRGGVVFTVGHEAGTVRCGVCETVNVHIVGPRVVRRGSFKQLRDGLADQIGELRVAAAEQAEIARYDAGAVDGPPDMGGSQHGHD